MFALVICIRYKYIVVQSLILANICVNFASRMSNFQILQKTLHVDLGKQHEVANPNFFFIIIHFDIFAFSQSSSISCNSFTSKLNDVCLLNRAVYFALYHFKNHISFEHKVYFANQLHLIFSNYVKVQPISPKNDK